MEALFEILLKEDFWFAVIRSTTPILLTTLGAMIAARAGARNIAVAVMTPFMYVGFDVIPQAAEEMNIPFKKIGQILILSVVMAVVWYVAIIGGVSLAMSSTQIETSELVTADAMANVFFNSPIASKVLIIGGIAGILTSWNSFYVGGSRAIYSMAESGMLPSFLARLHHIHPDFPRLMADLEIYVNGVAGKQVQSANAIVDAVSATIMKQHNPGLTDPQLRQLIAAHIDDDSFCRYVIQQDINKIALDLREAHKDDFFSVPEDSPLEDFLQAAEETAKEDSDPEQAAMMFICKRLKLNYKKLSEEEKKWLKRIAQKSDLLKNPKPQRGRK